MQDEHKQIEQIRVNAYVTDSCYTVVIDIVAVLHSVWPAVRRFALVGTTRPTDNVIAIWYIA